MATNAVVVFGDGAGGFVQPHDIVGGSHMATADIDEDDVADLVGSGLTASDLNLLLNRLDGGRDPS